MSHIAPAAMFLIAAPIAAQVVTPFPIDPDAVLAARFEKAPVPTQTMVVDSVVIADFDGDGLGDIVVAARLSSSTTAYGVRYYRNRGDDIFDDITATGIVGGPTILGKCVLADLDGDGDPDVVGPERWLRNNSGTFVVEALPATSSSRLCVAVGDLDGDSDLDLYVGIGFGGGPPRQDRLMINDGTGAFSFAPTTALPNDSDNTQDVQLFDADGDGDLDAVIGIERESSVTGGARLYLNDGTGNFTDGSVNFPVAMVDVLGVEVADFDLDGDIDVVLGTTAGFTSQPPPDYFMRNNGSGQFVLDAAAIPNVLADTSDVLAADIDNDGDVDLLLADGIRNNEPQRVYRNDVTAFVDVTSTWLPAETLHAGQWAAGDFDGDNHLDVALATGTTSAGRVGRLRVYHNQGGTSFLLLNPARVPESAHSSTGAASLGSYADIDGDGDLDFFEPVGGGASAPAQQLLLRNDGHARMTLVSATQLPELVSAYTAQFVDIDIDGDQDLVLGTYNGFVLWLNDGTGNFVLPPPNAIPAGTTRIASLAIGDVDGDGDLDIFGGREPLSQFDELLRNNGSGIFSRDQNALPTHSNTGVRSCAMLDYDDDGDLDIIAAWSSGYSGSLSVYENDGMGQFSIATGVLPAIANANRLLAFDADGDSDLDLIVRSGSSLVLVTDIGTTFASVGSGLNALLQSSQDPLPLDYEGDGDLDLSVSRFGQRFILLREANQQFRELDTPLFASGSDPVPGADLDGDGDADFLRFSAFQPRSLACGRRLHLYAPLLARIDKPYELQLHCRAGEVGKLVLAWFVLNTTQLSAAVNLPPFGPLTVDPVGAMVGFGVTPTPQDGDRPWGLKCKLALPNSPALIGSILYSQALLMTEQQFAITNTIPDEIH